MPRFFNTAGVCEPRDHYMPPRQRLPGLAALLDKKSYFVVHAPRQGGKTTCFHHLARERPNRLLYPLAPAGHDGRRPEDPHPAAVTSGECARTGT